ncbi:DMT family transporter [Saccharomonospora halophila]|uniref:DMT family transporter n=1 Tax=Saccharomonospora halophila TaxID=129922 RepID=UPI0003689A84|nr:DMT family transporter [Saccharomonospora halophila]
MTTPRAPGDAEPPPNAANLPSVRAKQILGTGLAVLVGVGMAVQSRINGQLAAELADPVLAAVISFGGGLVVLLGALAAAPRMRRGVGRVTSALRTGGLRPWHLLGGLAGATLVLGQSVTVVVIGVALFTVGVVAGQTVSGLFVDKAGLGPGGAQAPSRPRVVGAVLTVLAIAGTVTGGLGDAEAGSAWLLVLPLVAGGGMALQQAFNGHVGAVAGSPLTAALVNFTAGTAVLVPAWLGTLALGGGPVTWPANPVLYLGGLVGVVFIATAALLVPRIGVLLLGLASVAGQLVGSVLLDLFVPAADVGVGASTVLGCAVALLAVAVASVGGRGRTGAVLRESRT